MIELDLEAVAVVAVACHLRQRGVSLGADGHVFISLIVDHNRAGFVLLILTALEKGVPVIHDNVDGVHARGVEQLLLIPHDGRGLLHTEAPGVYKKKGGKQRKDKDDTADFVDMSVR